MVRHKSGCPWGQPMTAAELDACFEDVPGQQHRLQILAKRPKLLQVVWNLPPPLSNLAGMIVAGVQAGSWWYWNEWRVKAFDAPDTPENPCVYHCGQRLQRRLAKMDHDRPQFTWHAAYWVHPQYEPLLGGSPDFYQRHLARRLPGRKEKHA